jgi:signal transduction histidine kinase/CheY-like chemotaxis protein
MQSTAAEARQDPGRERLRAEQIRLLYRSGPPGVVAALTGGIVATFLIWHVGARSPAGVQAWLAVLGFITVLHVLLARAYWRRQRVEGDWRRWAYGFVVLGGCEGAIWGTASLYLADPTALTQQLLAMLCLCAVVTAAISVFGAYLPAFHAVLFPATIPFIAVSLLQGGVLHAGVAFMVFNYTVCMVVLARMHNGTIVEMLRLRFENADLAAELRVQKDAAEQASQAKTRFLAAASHDLRQPVHALSLFVGVLRGYALDEAPRRVVDRIEDSVNAMDGLFGALLNISRLDAGVVTPEWQVFAIQPLLEALERDYSAEAAAKGLRLRICPCARFVRSDPVLLERILRNLVSNAVNYTDSGGVLIGCRPGPGVRIQVWDTGRGIPAPQVQQVFEEFYQIDNPERDRSKGLGLGLAIVRRLVDLLGHRLEIVSVVGRGSRFSIEVPAAQPAAAAPAAPICLGAPKGLILVIDDEAMIQEGMRNLLQGWGHSVLCAGSGDDMLALLARNPALPDVIICDYRLRGEETGIAVIDRLRARFRSDIPAMLITGDTAPDRLEEVSRSGFLLLHKPVAHGRLRAAIGNLMRAGVNA